MSPSVFAPHASLLSSPWSHSPPPCRQPATLRLVFSVRCDCGQPASDRQQRTTQTLPLHATPRHPAPLRPSRANTHTPPARLHHYPSRHATPVPIQPPTS
ncbi:hypothetical protein Pmani_028671 [Petrolisthes manimaculis]|uniref:Uncharacterized protein n=1 Tax=Petrolisthes manimaculis TaxID=1843537 RepID=A0AAE1P1T4_9EUCA|nr:hypothetical protein Pmani_028671 [Petrolisthes manimaculis]